ncbi:hypothetical protein Hypma_012637 [Hypsizygus marmoreus]|uniref:Uncharacterized protein n=1 Tax=Hypsizygus marmoreus TaxID=39966 RepID=A0A369JEI6_HYPMA|nr:hypothetical protein Hypma_012637 [Hypsizygus marmoreus]
MAAIMAGSVLDVPYHHQVIYDFLLPTPPRNPFSDLSKLQRLSAPNVPSHGSDALSRLALFRQGTSFEMTSRALRAFILMQDYASAFIVLRTFRIFRPPISTKPSLVITRPIVKQFRCNINKASNVICSSFVALFKFRE